MLRKEDSQSHIHLLNRLAGGHSGAICALLDLLRCGRDVQVPVGVDAVRCMRKLEALDIKGIALYSLWTDVCNSNASSMIEMLRSCDSELVDVTRDTMDGTSLDPRPGDWLQHDRLGVE